MRAHKPYGPVKSLTIAILIGSGLAACALIGQIIVIKAKLDKIASPLKQVRNKNVFIAFAS
jgi:hypothetical protein